MTALQRAVKRGGSRKSGPDLKPENGKFRVTFWWRDLNGTQTPSPIKTRLAQYHRRDHHQNARPQSLKRIPGYRWSGSEGECPAVAGELLFYPFRK